MDNGVNIATSESPLSSTNSSPLSSPTPLDALPVPSSTLPQAIPAPAPARTSARVAAARLRQQQQQVEQDSLIPSASASASKGKAPATRPRSAQTTQTQPQPTIQPSKRIRVRHRRHDPSKPFSDSEEDSDDDTRPPPRKRPRISLTSRARTTTTTGNKPTMSKKPRGKNVKPSFGDAGPSRVHQHRPEEDVEMAENSDFGYGEDTKRNILVDPSSTATTARRRQQDRDNDDEDDDDTETIDVPIIKNEASTAADEMIVEESNLSSRAAGSPPSATIPTSVDATTNANTTNANDASSNELPIPPSNSTPPSNHTPIPPPIPLPTPPPAAPAEQTLASLMATDGSFQFGAYMASLGSRLKTILTNIKPTADPSTRLMALQDLSEILSMSTEDNLNGYFAMDEFVRVLVGVMGGKGRGEGEGSEEGEGEREREAEAEREGDGGDGEEEEEEQQEAVVEAVDLPSSDAITQPLPETISGDISLTDQGMEATTATTATTDAPTESTIQLPLEIQIEPVTPVPEPLAPVDLNSTAESAPAPEPTQTLESPRAPEQALPVESTLPAEQPTPTVERPTPAAESSSTHEQPIPPPEPTQIQTRTQEQTQTLTQTEAQNAMLVDMMADMDEDAALAAALAMSAGDAGLDLATLGGIGIGMDIGDMGGMGAMGEGNLEEQLLACRCLANLMEAMPGSAHTLVYHGAVPVLCSKLLQITFIDLAEQTISTLEKLSEEYPSAIVREGGLSALLSYLDFFSTHVQRTALQAAANCCRNMSADSFSAIKDVFPTLRAVLSYSDQRLVEYAALCVIRTIESFARGATESLEGLLSEGVVRDIMNLLVPGGGTSGFGVGNGGGGGGAGGAMISSGTMTLFLRALSTAAKNSPKIAITLLEGGMAGTVYTILTGVLPPNDLGRLRDEQGGDEAGQGVGSGLADMAVMQNLAGRPKEMVEEALSLVCELMPPLPRDGVFDPRGYTEKSIGRALKSRVKEAKGGRSGTSAAAGNTNAVASTSNPSASLNIPEADVEGDTDADVSTASPIKIEPQDVEVADMLLVPEQETEATTPLPEMDVQMNTESINTPAESIVLPITVLDRDVVMVDGTSAVEVVQPPFEGPQGDVVVVPAMNYNPAMTNADGEPLMAMMTDEAVADLPNTTPATTGEPGESQGSQPTTSSATGDAALEIPPEVAAAVANLGASSSSRHRHGESSTTQARLKLLREKPEVVSRFLFLVVPILFDVFSASVTLQVRMRCFLGILKATSFVDGPGMELLYKNVPVASFIGSILTSRDSPMLVTNALQLVELLLVKSPSVFRSSLRKEGVLHEVSTISKIELKIKAKPVPPPTEAAGDHAEANPSEEGSIPPPVPVVTPRKSSSVPSDPQDAYVLRARFIKVKYLSGGSDAGGDAVFESLKSMIKALGDVEATGEQLGGTLKEIAKLFGSSGETISSFELLKSGLVDGLLAFATDPGRTVDVEKRKDLFLDAFSARSGYATPSSQTPLAVLVKRLQESLTRMESFDVVTTSPGSMDDAKRSSMALISRTLRLKLAAEDPADVPKSCHSLMVSIHAIAPFSALEDYLKPRIAGILSFRPELSPGLLQALAGSGLPSSTLAQSMLARLTARVGSGSSGSSGAGATSTLGSFLHALTAPSSSESGPSTPATVTAGTASGSLPIPIPARRGTGESGSSTSTLEPPPPVSHPASSESSLSRRRSLRLRGQPPADAQPSTSGAADAPAQASSSTSVPIVAPTASGSESRAALASSLLHQLLADEAELEDDLDGEIGGEGEDAVADRTFNLAFDAANGGLTASTPQGTRVATPLSGTTPSIDAPIASLAATNAAGPSTGAAAKMTYAGVAASAIEKATDFYLEFSLNAEVLPMDMTVYGACHQYESRRSTDGQPNPHAVWNGNYTVTYRKVPGKRPVRESSKDAEAMETDIVAGLTADSPSSKILRLLRVLYRINAEGIEHLDSKMKIVTIPDAAFINNKLTAKLARQLEEIMILASNCLPDWALDLPQAFGFLFPFSTRYLFLQSTSFGYARLLNRVISQTPRDAPNNSRRDGLDQYGRLQRRKVEVPRDSPMQVALKVFDLFGSSSSILDVHFQGEVGTGLGPTLEFFASVCREFAWRDLKLWRDADSTLSGKYVHHPLGLFPAPMLNLVVDGAMATERDRRKVRLYRLLGQFVARSLLDSRIIDVSFNKIFLKLILGDHVPLTITSIKVIDPALGSSLGTLQEFANMKREIEGVPDITAEEKVKRIAMLDVKGVALEDMCLDFTVPGYDDLELKPSGKDIDVTANNVEEYIELAIDAIMGRGARAAIQAFKAGFSTVFPVSDLRTFSAEELVMMFGNADEDWSAETLTEAIKADHGFNVESKAIRDLIEIMTLYDKNSRRDFLQFLTGSPKLPIGGFKALSPQLTVVRKPHEAPLTPDDYLPSVMTCAHYLKMPSYSSRAVMEKKLMMAMREGTGSFHLS